MPKFHVLIPIAGHASLTVEADNEKDAIDAAMDKATKKHIKEWEVLRMFNQGNVCYCPSPWEAEAELADDDEYEDEDEDEDG